MVLADVTFAPNTKLHVNVTHQTRTHTALSPQIMPLENTPEYTGMV